MKDLNRLSVVSVHESEFQRDSSSLKINGSEVSVHKKSDVIYDKHEYDCDLNAPKCNLIEYNSNELNCTFDDLACKSKEPESNSNEPPECKVTDCSTNGDDWFVDIRKLKDKYSKHVMLGHLNVNSLGPKIDEVQEMLHECKLDLLVLSETKLDGSYKQELLDMAGYSCARQDKRSNSGGLLVYISNDIPYSAGSMNICNDEIECISIELNISEEKILLLGMYKNPKMDPVLFKRYFEETCEKALDSFENIIILGDLNFNMFLKNMLSTLIPTYNLTNMIKEPTCNKSSHPTLIDVMLVTKRRKFMGCFSKNIGISDFHNLIGGFLKIHKPAPKTRRIFVRRISKINYENVIAEISENEMLQMTSLNSDPNSAYNALQEYLLETLDKHAPKKEIILRKSDFHCM